MAAEQQNIAMCLRCAMESACKQRGRARQKALRCLVPIFEALIAHAPKLGDQPSLLHGTVLFAVLVESCVLPLSAFAGGMLALAPILPTLAAAGAENASISSSLSCITGRVNSALGQVQQKCSRVHAAVLKMGAAFAQHRQLVYAQQLEMLMECSAEMSGAVQQLERALSMPQVT